MRTGGFAVLTLVALIVGAAASASARPLDSQEFVPGEVIVQFKPGLAARNRTSILRTRDATLERDLPAAGAALVNLPAGESVAEAVRRFNSHPGIVSVQPNFVYETAAMPSDPLFGLLWGLNNTGQVVGIAAGAPDADIDAPEAWDLTTGSNAVRVAVVDTGVEYDHPDLVGNIGVGRDFYSGDSDPRDEHGHGTHVAGTIGARNNGIGGIGVSWQVGLMPVRVLGPTGSGTTATITSGFAYAAQRGARIVNASFGGRTYDPVMAAVIANAPETLFVVAAGNGGGDGIGDDNDLPGSAVYPCNFGSPNVVCVAATDLNDSLATFSNHGTTSVDLAAPGVRIRSTYVGGEYAYLQGTSMAAPHVAGVAALLLARNPATTVAQLRAALLGTVDVLAPLQTKLATSGRLNAHKALLALAPSAAPTPAPAPLASPAPRAVKKKVNKVTFCFRKRTIKVAKSQVARYKTRGAKLVACRKPRKRR